MYDFLDAMITQQTSPEEVGIISIIQPHIWRAAMKQNPKGFQRVS